MSRCSVLSLSIHPSSVHDDGDDDSSGCTTPPFTRSASIPFKWEKEPGKPIPCTDLVPYSEPICMKTLIPPPRMTSVESKVISRELHTTVLDGSSLGSMERMMSGREKKCRKLGKGMFGSWSWSGRRRCKMGVKEGHGGSFVYPSSTAADFDDGWECCSEFGGESEFNVEQVKMTKMKKTRSFFKFTQVRH